MTEQEYRKLTDPFRRNPRLAGVLNLWDKAAVLVVAASYGGVLLWEFVHRDPRLDRCIAVPFVSLVVVSVFRCLLNRRRPYEVFGVEPVIPRSKTGKSFPSRHVFSAFIIAMIFLLCTPFPAYGILLLLLGVLIASMRVLSGVHYPSDVLAGAAFGVLAGLLCRLG